MVDRSYQFTNDSMIDLAVLSAGGTGLICVSKHHEPFYQMLADIGLVAFGENGPRITDRTVEIVNTWREQTTLVRLPERAA